MTYKVHGNEVFLRSLIEAELENLKNEAANISHAHKAALNEQLERLEIK